ncbi:MAG: class E sortase [Actinobacteria bacterium]|nr:MAG: class E sortase [Actinomycetota bacterium]
MSPRRASRTRRSSRCCEHCQRRLGATGSTRAGARRSAGSAFLVTGTDHDSLTKGPGWDMRTYLPGAGELIYIAGHRTTYLAPFAHIENIRVGDFVIIQVPYGTFQYRVFRHVVVPSTDLGVLRSHGREVVELQACHPRFFATHRYIVYARLMRVEPRGGRAFRPPATHVAAAPLASSQG